MRRLNHRYKSPRSSDYQKILSQGPRPTQTSASNYNLQNAISICLLATAKPVSTLGYLPNSSFLAKCQSSHVFCARGAERWLGKAGAGPWSSLSASSHLAASWHRLPSSQGGTVAGAVRHSLSPLFQWTPPLSRQQLEAAHSFSIANPPPAPSLIRKGVPPTLDPPAFRVLTRLEEYAQEYGE